MNSDVSKLAQINQSKSIKEEREVGGGVGGIEYKRYHPSEWREREPI